MSEQAPSPITESEAVSDGVRVSVKAQYSAQHSNPAQSRWFFLYQIQIRNEAEQTVQLTDRHWIITDGQGKVEEVQGEGVVGEKPVIEPGQVFQYTSGCPLETPMGHMRGTYRMVWADGSVFDAVIAEFELIEAMAIH
jgi:ApaG protein